VFGVYVLLGGTLRASHRKRSALPQAPNTQTFLPACLLSTACVYYELNCFDPHVPPSAPERTLQASGQGQAIARPKGGPPR
jgi:hypothetical protein